MIALKILAAVFILLQIALMLYRDWKHYDRRTKKYKAFTVSQIGIVILAIVFLAITSCFEYKKEQALQGEIDKLQTTITDLNTNLEPLRSLAENTQETYFVLKNKQEEVSPDGTYKVFVALEPVGKRIIPLLKIQCKTRDGVKVKDIKVEGATVPTISYKKQSNDGTYFSREFRTLEPSKVSVTILTDGVSKGINVVIDPFKIKDEIANAG